MADKSQQTEKPTARRLEKARREGNFPASKEFVAGVQFLAFVAILGAWGPDCIGHARQMMRFFLACAFRPSLDAAEVMRLFRQVALQNLAPLAATGGLILLATLATQLIATQMGFSFSKLMPDFNRLNPLSHLRELPRRNLPALFQAMVFLPLFAAAIYALVKDQFASYLRLPLMSVETGSRAVAASMEKLLWKAAGLFLVLGAVDLFRQQRRYTKDLRMSKQEIREESKDTEGNPQIKMRVRRLQRELLRKQMMKEIPKATAVVVNPTHFAVALRYQMDSMTAPLVVAKGKNYLALRIRQKATEHQVPIVENPPLAQALYKSAEVGQEIPPHLYRAVAEILAYVFRIVNGRPPARAG
jgi:flagellar biosynthetic protein FlhB